MTKENKKVTTVREHPRNVAISLKNPDGITMVDRHSRRLKGTYLDRNEIEAIFGGYARKNLVYPTPGKLKEYKNADTYDEIIAVWTEYFNKKLNTVPPNSLVDIQGKESGSKAGAIARS